MKAAEMAVGPPPGVPGYRVLSLLESPRPRRIAMSPRAGHLVVATVCIGAFMGQLDASIVSVALPHLASGFRVSIGAAEWVSLAYVLVLVALVAPIGAWADAIGRKSLYVGGFAIFTAASAGCALSPDLATLCLCRVLQAVGAAMLQANSVALIAAATPPAKLGRSVGVQAAAQAVGLAAGPALGGALLAIGSWRLLFLVNVPTGIVGLATGALLLPRSRDLGPMRRVDPRGLAGFVPTVGLVLVALSFAAGHGSIRLISVPVAAAAALVGALLIRHQRRTAHPLVDPQLLTAPGFRRGLLTGFLAYAALFGALVVVPLFFATAHLSGPARLGAQLSALPIGIGVVAPIAGRWADRHARRLTVAGLATATAAFVGFAAWRPTGAGLSVVLAVIGVGLGCLTPANNRSVMAAAPPGAAGLASGLLNMTRGLGTATGTAIAVVTFTAVGPAGGGLDAAKTAMSVTGLCLAVCCALALIVATRRR